MQHTYQWKVLPTGEPSVIRNCPKCGIHAKYECSGNFRVNANHNQIDVWLIYQCRDCKSTWNMEILSRVPIKSINKDAYHKFLNNDTELAKHYAFDIATHHHNKAMMSYEDITLEISGDPVQTPENNLQIEICCDYALDIRLDRILSKQLGLSREALKKSSIITCVNHREEILDIRKAKLKDRLIIKLQLSS